MPILQPSKCNRWFTFSPSPSPDLCTAYIALRKYTVSSESWSFSRILPLRRWCDFDSNLDEARREGGAYFLFRRIDRSKYGGKGTLSNEWKFRISGDVIRILVIVEFRENCTYWFDCIFILSERRIENIEICFVMSK